MANAFVWVDIPVLDLDRAIKFYSAVFGASIKKESFSGMSLGVLPHGDKDVSGCLFSTEGEKPSQQGPLLYLNCQGRLDEAIAAAENNGGKVLMAKEPMGPYGFRAIVVDSEGNRVALHSM